MTLSQRQQLLAAARGETPCDLLIRNARVINVYSGEVLPGNVAIAGGRIAYCGPNSRPAACELDAGGRYVSPGWIEPHAHPWLLYNPVTMAEAVLPRGTTTVFNDTLAFWLHGAGASFPRLVAALRDLPVRYRWLLRIASQSPYEGESEEFAAERILPLLELPEVAGTAEMTRWPLVMRGDSDALRPIVRALELGKRADGHTAGAGYEKLAAVAAGGISACHEAIAAGEALDRLRLGYWTMLRHSSLRPDLPELARAIVEHRVDTRRLLVTMDAPSPRFIAEGGFLDEALRRLVEAGVPAMTALQMVTINPATYYGLDSEIGGIAPGRAADLVFLDDLETFRPVRVLAAGR
ncbi:MAG: adenine deaminase, partial [Burkholderiales bacterium]|nr:adenine deaminase [Burkholderiales bacterium]